MMQNGGVPPDDDILALRDSCTRFLHGHGPGRAADLLATVPAESVTDRYGEGGAVAELEGEIARLLGKAAAVFVPSGTMAQQAVLRVHADRRQRRTIVFHPACHIDRHEGRGYERLHGLVGRPAGGAERTLPRGAPRGVAAAPGPRCPSTGPGCGSPRPGTASRLPCWPTSSTPCTCRSTRAWARCRGPAWPGRVTWSPR